MTKRKLLSKEEIKAKSKKELFERAKDLICLLNYRVKPFSHYHSTREYLKSPKIIGFYCRELDNILSYLNLDIEDLEEAEKIIDNFNTSTSIENKDFVDLAGERRKFLERYRSYGDETTSELAEILLREELKRPSEDFNSYITHKIEYYTNKEENSNSDKEAQKYADLCSVYVSMQNILDSQED